MASAPGSQRWATGASGTEKSPIVAIVLSLLMLLLLLLLLLSFMVVARVVFVVVVRVVSPCPSSYYYKCVCCGRVSTKICVRPPKHEHGFGNDPAEIRLAMPTSSPEAISATTAS